MARTCVQWCSIFDGCSIRRLGTLRLSPRFQPDVSCSMVRRIFMAKSTSASKTSDRIGIRSRLRTLDACSEGYAVRDGENAQQRCVAYDDLSVLGTASNTKWAPSWRWLRTFATRYSVPCLLSAACGSARAYYGARSETTFVVYSICRRLSQ